MAIDAALYQIGQCAWSEVQEKGVIGLHEVSGCGAGGMDVGAEPKTVTRIMRPASRAGSAAAEGGACATDRLRRMSGRAGRRDEGTRCVGEGFLKEPVPLAVRHILMLRRSSATGVRRINPLASRRSSTPVSVPFVTRVAVESSAQVRPLVSPAWR